VLLDINMLYEVVNSVLKERCIIKRLLLTMFGLCNGLLSIFGMCNGLFMEELTA